MNKQYVKQSETIIRDENNTQPIQKQQSKQDLQQGTDDTLTKTDKQKNVDKQSSIKNAKQNQVQTQENDNEESSVILKSKHEQNQNEISMKNESKKLASTQPGNDDWDSQSKKKQTDSQINKKEGFDLFADLPGPPPNLRDIHKKSNKVSPSANE